MKENETLLIPRNYEQYKWIMKWVIRFIKEHNIYKFFKENTHSNPIKNYERYQKYLKNIHNDNYIATFDDFFIYKCTLGDNYFVYERARKLFDIFQLTEAWDIYNGMNDKWHEFIEEHQVKEKFKKQYSLDKIIKP